MSAGTAKELINPFEDDTEADPMVRSIDLIPQQEERPSSSNSEKGRQLLVG